MHAILPLSSIVSNGNHVWNRNHLPRRSFWLNDCIIWDSIFVSALTLPANNANRSDHPTTSAISLSLNIILTLLIVGRIWHHERSIKVLFGRDHSHSRPYQLLRTMFIESAALLSIFSILLLVTFALGNPINQIWLGTTPAIQVWSFLSTHRL